jgi:hypothetical protein
MPVCAVAGLTGHGHIWLGVDDHGEAGAHKGLVVDEDDTQRIRRMSLTAGPRLAARSARARGCRVPFGSSRASILPAPPPSSLPRAPVSWASTASPLVSWASIRRSWAPPLVSSASVPASWIRRPRPRQPRLPASWDSDIAFAVGNRASTRNPVIDPKALPATAPEENPGFASVCSSVRSLIPVDRIRRAVSVPP